MDKIRGVLYGQAIGDALGLPAEFKSAKAIQIMRKDWGAWPDAYHATGRSRNSWQAGEWSDDTEQALCILDAYIQGIREGADPKSPMDLLLVADYFVRWAQTNGRGMGNHTWTVLQDTLFLVDPHVVSMAVWEQSGKNAAPNGAVMRTAYMGILHPDDLDWTARESARVAQTTHYDPRCVASTVAVSTTIAALVGGSLTIPEAIQVGIDYGQRHHGEVEKYATLSLKELHLDEGIDQTPAIRKAPIGYTYKCMGAGFWALQELVKECDAVPGFALHPGVRQDLFTKVLQKVILAGGDADTNGAVAGAMLGAAVGFRGIPPHLIEGLFDRQQLESRLSLLPR